MSNLLYEGLSMQTKCLGDNDVHSTLRTWLYVVLSQ